MKTKIIATIDQDHNLMILDPENELIPNKPIIFNQVMGCGFNTQGIQINLYNNKENDISIVRVNPYLKREDSQSQYVNLKDSRGETGIDESHFCNIIDRLDLILEQAEPYEIGIDEFAEFIFQLNCIHTEESADDFLDENGNWSLDVMRANIEISNKLYINGSEELCDN